MSRLTVSVTLFAILAALSAGQPRIAEASFIQPHWLKVPEKQALKRESVAPGLFERHYTPTRPNSRSSSRFETRRRLPDIHVAVRVLWSAVDVIRVSFDRGSHRISGAMQFCERHGRGSSEPRAVPRR